MVTATFEYVGGPDHKAPGYETPVPGEYFYVSMAGRGKENLPGASLK